MTLDLLDPFSVPLSLFKNIYIYLHFFFPLRVVLYLVRSSFDVGFSIEENAVMKVPFTRIYKIAELQLSSHFHHVVDEKN